MTHRTRVKICGITRPEDALLCEQLGADALGFVFCRASKRYIDPDLAKPLCNGLSPFTTRVGLFLDEEPAVVEHALTALPQLVPQFHGRETPAMCERFKVPYIKAIGLGSGMPSKTMLSEYESAVAFLFDSNEPGQLGGTGHTFDWQQLDAYAGKPMVLAGGLAAHNVTDAIEQIRPYSVDVSSGVEAGKGIKDADLLRTFFKAVAEADANINGSNL